MKLSQRFGAVALAVGATVGLNGCSTTYGEDKLPEVMRGTYHCESEKLGATISFDTKDMVGNYGGGIDVGTPHLNVVDLSTGLHVELYKGAEWVCETPSGGTTVLFSPL